MQIIQSIQNKIYEIRGQRVMLDYDLAEMYDTETKYLKRSVKSNIKKFPTDFMFELTKQEYESLRCNISTSKRGGTRYMPFAFTEHGVTMLASVLNSDKAIEMNIAIVRAFINIRHYISQATTLNDKLNDIRLELKTRIDEHDVQLNAIYDSLENLLDKKQDEIAQQENWAQRKRIGFKTGKK